jgi:hypothetical protein
MAVLRISYNKDSDPTAQWTVEEVGGESTTCENLSINVPSWTLVDDSGYYIECNGQVTKVDNSINIRSE